MNTPPLLPSDRYLASLLGLSEEDYRRFRAEVRSRTRIEPGKPQAGLETLVIISIVATVISVGLTIAAMFFKPKASKGGGGARTRNKQGDDITSNQKFSPRFGFDGVQNPATIGTLIPLVFTLRLGMSQQDYEDNGEFVVPPRPSGTYGGVRVNTSLLWSQLQSQGGNQMLRALLMLGEGPIGQLDQRGFAIGDNTLGVYEMDALVTDSTRFTMYWKPNGGRIVGTDYFAGRTASADPGNAQNGGAEYVFSIKGRENLYRDNFCFTYKPSTSTTFGVYAHIPNDFPYREEPKLRPTINLQTKPHGDAEDEEYKVVIDDDPQALADTWRAKYSWSSRCGIIYTQGSDEFLGPGEELTYLMSHNTDKSTQIEFNQTNTDNKKSDIDGLAKARDIAQTVAATQRAADDNLQIGELYKIGSALGVLIARSGNDSFTAPDSVFNSQVDVAEGEDGNSMWFKFRIVRGGFVGPEISRENQIDYEHYEHKNSPNDNKIYPPEWEKPWRNKLSDKNSLMRFKTASKGAQIFRCALANLATLRVCQIFEVGIRSSVGIRISGFTNMTDDLRMDQINYNAGGKFSNNVYDNDERFNVSNYSSGQIQVVAERYSFFKIQYRNANDVSSDFFELQGTFGVRSITSQAFYNYLRFEMPALGRWEVRFEPVTSYEIRNGLIYEPLCILDGKLTTEQSYTFTGGLKVYWTGTYRARDRKKFDHDKFEPDQDLGFGWTDDNTMLDDWAKVAEAFAYRSVTTTVNDGPEHEIAYVNILTPNQRLVEYDNIAHLGLNIKASTEWNQFNQFSAYVTEGLKVRASSATSNTLGSSNLFPDLLYDLLTSTRYGVGNAVTEEQIDKESFARAVVWCNSRRYFYDGIITERLNLREWAADTAGTMLLDLVQRDGKWGLEPALVFPSTGTSTGKLPIKGLFTTGNIVEDSFSLEYTDEADREPIQVSVKYREERFIDDLSNPGFFASEREVIVREASRPDTDPMESFDLSDYVTSFEHAVDFACYVIRMRRMITHSIRFSTTPDGLTNGLRPADYIQVAMDTVHYDDFANGVVMGDGTLVTTQPLAMPAGTYDVALWRGGDFPIEETTMTVFSNGTASPKSCFFVKKSTTSNLRVYKVESISIDEKCVITIDAVHHPTDSDLKSEIGKNWTTYATDSNWVIETG